MTGKPTEFLNIQQLRVFKAVAKTANISRAAEAVHLSQSATSRAISGLEKELGVELFVRTTQGVERTLAGDLLLRRTRRAFAQLERGLSILPSNNVVPRARINHIRNSHLRNLIAVSQHENFSVAARHLNIAQSTVHKSLSDLQQALGSTLFIVHNNRVLLENSGERLTRSAKLAFVELEYARQDIAEIRGDTGGKLRVGALPLALSDLVPSAVAQLIRLYPDIDVSIEVASYDRHVKRLIDGEIDILISALRSAENPLVKEVKLFEDEFSIYCSVNNKILSRPEVSLQDLHGLPWVLTAVGSIPRVRIKSIFSDIGLSEPPCSVAAESHSAIRGMMIHGDRISFLPHEQARYDEQNGTICRLSVQLPDFKVDEGYIVRADFLPTPAIEKLIEFLEERAKKIVQRKTKEVGYLSENRP